MKCAARRSSRSAAFSSAAARVSAGVLLQRLKPPRAATIAALASVSVASAMLPAAEVGSAAMAETSCSSAARSPNSMPREFFRLGPYRSRGNGILGWAAFSALPIMSAGRRSNCDAGTVSSAASATKDELAPFSSNRRTR